MGNEKVLSVGRSEIYYNRTIYGFTLIASVGSTFSIAISSYGLVLALLTWFLKMIREKRLEVEKTPLDYFFLAYVCAELLATAFSINPWQSFVNMRRILLISIVYLVFTFVSREDEIRRALSILIGVTSLVSLYEIIYFFRSHVDRLAVLQDYMRTGSMKMIILLLLIPFLLHRQTPMKLKILGFICLVPILVALIFTYTRSAWLGFISGLLILGILKNRYLIFLVIGIVVLFLLFAPSALRERAYSIVDPHHPNNLSRVHMWSTGIKMFKDYPIFGTGDIDLKQLYLTYTTPIDPDEGGHLHNNFIHLLVTLGLVGFLAAMALFVRIFLMEFFIFKTVSGDWFIESVALGALAAFVGFQINGLFEWSFGAQQVVLLVWFTVGLVLAARKLESRRLQQITANL